MRLSSIIASLLLIGLLSCKKDKDSNPYDSWNSGSRGPSIQDKDIDPNTIQGLHKNIFKPTCSNSGCHDGNFEPDFRSVESSYNSLVNRFCINTDPNKPQLVKRVIPGDAAQSMLIHRLETFIPGSQGVMPLSVDPGSDWDLKKSEYIENIKNWINDGAKDQFGQSPDQIDFKPQLAGLIAFADGSPSPLPHDGYNPVSLPIGTQSVKIMFAFLDDKTPINQFDTAEMGYSLNPYQYDSAFLKLNPEAQSFSAPGIGGANVQYWHSITVDVSDLGLAGDVVWLRTKLRDNVNESVFIPTDATPFNFKKYFAIRIN